MDEKYYYIRFTWWRKVDLEAVEREMGESFTVLRLDTPDDHMDILGSREKLRVKADTLGVNLAPERAVLYQSEAGLFTSRDVELRRRILELYPRDRSTPFPMFFQEESKYKVAPEVMQAPS
jgi:hypothetical protein